MPRWSRRRERTAPVRQATLPASDDHGGRIQFEQPFRLGVDLYDLAWNPHTSWQAMLSPHSRQLVVFEPSGRPHQFDLSRFPAGRWFALWAGQQQLPMELYLDRSGAYARWLELP